LKYAARAVIRGRHGALLDGEFQAPDWDLYTMDLQHPFEPLEPFEREVRIIDKALQALVDVGILPHVAYDRSKYLAMRDAVQGCFEIPWTAITPRVQRLIYAINAIHRPMTMIAAGVFCGNTFISNAGAAVGPGAVYSARSLVGLEIVPAEAERAERNVRRIDPTGVARIVAGDAVAFCAAWPGTIDLLYLDADEGGPTGKSVYRRIMDEAWPKMEDGALILAHNSVNSAAVIKDYLEFVRSSRNCRASLNIVVDGEGLEVSMK
jgi:predicted O-methyltransferase YrrM